MNATKQLPRHAIGGVFTLALCLAAQSVAAQVEVDAIVTPLIGAFRYDISVFNSGAEDLAIVSLDDAPPGDPLIDPSLVTPPGFLASYDGGLGFVDFLANADIFAAGCTVSGFSFESLTAPVPYFTTFEALGVLGSSFTGSIKFNVSTVPETGSTLLMAGLGFWVLALADKKLSRS